ncbi:unnamed protein product, partial [Rotaria sordida]
MYSIIIHHKTLVTPGEQPLILVAQPSAYAKRANNEANMIQALRAGKRKSVKKILYMSTASAKYVLPLDDPL